MKKFSILLLACITVCTSAFAQEPKVLSNDTDTISNTERLQQQVTALTERMSSLESQAHNQAVWGNYSKYLNIGYDFQKLEGGLKSKFGVSLSRGKTYYLHADPLWNMVKIGIDWSSADVNYAQYKAPSFDYDEDDDFSKEMTLHHATVGMQVGPSITVNPVDQLKTSVYFRVTPSYSMTFDSNNKFNGTYATFFNLGLSVAWKSISVGVEQRWGKTKYYDVKPKVNSTRLYVGFRM